jgi:hypothetical protein
MEGQASLKGLAALQATWREQAEAAIAAATDAEEKGLFISAAAHRERGTALNACADDLALASPPHAGADGTVAAASTAETRQVAGGSDRNGQGVESA